MLFSLPITASERLAARRAQGTDGVDRLPLHPRVGVVEQGHEIAEQPVVARCRLEEDVDGLDPNLGGFVVQQGTHRRDGFPGSRTEVADRGEERSL